MFKLSKRKMLVASVIAFLSGMTGASAADPTPTVDGSKKYYEIEDGTTTFSNGFKIDLTGNYAEADGLKISGHTGTVNVGDGTGTLHMAIGTGDSGNSVANGVWVDCSSNLTINGNLDISSVYGGSCFANGLAILNMGTGEGIYSSLTVNGNVTIGDPTKQDSLTETDSSEEMSEDKNWGVNAAEIHGGYGPDGHVFGQADDYTGARWAPTGVSITCNGKGSTINLNGSLYLSIRGTGLKTDPYYKDGDRASCDLATINVNKGDVTIFTPESDHESYHVAASYGGTINVNMKDDLSAGAGHKVVLQGNVLATKDDNNSGQPYYYQDGRVNLALDTADSSWTGVVDNCGVNKTGEINLWLQNGATWTHRSPSVVNGLQVENMPSPSKDHYGTFDGISHVTNFQGGASEAAAGNIVASSEIPISIANYSGHTNIYYSHTGNGETAASYTGGTVTIQNAAAGSSVSLITDSAGLTLQEANLVKIFNALASKLIYKADATSAVNLLSADSINLLSANSNDASNLIGYVKIADGLTGSSKILKTGLIAFTADGTGMYGGDVPTPEPTYKTGPIVESENIGETRESDTDGVVTISVTEAQTDTFRNAPSALYTVADAADPIVVDLQGHTLKLSTGGDAKKYLETVYVGDNTKIQIKDSAGTGALKISTGVDADGNADNSTNYTYGMYVDSSAELTSDVDVEIDGVKSTGSSRAHGIYVNDNGKVTFEKALTIKNVENKNTTGANTHAIYAAYAGANVTVKGNLTIENIAGPVLRANGGTITTAGGTITSAALPDSSVTKYAEYYAARAVEGTINLNTGDNITPGVLKVTGDLCVTDQSTSVINLNLTKDSTWTGAAINTASSSYNDPSGHLNLTMAAGSLWTHETGRSNSSLATDFAGSNISKLEGSGAIYQTATAGIKVFDYSGDHTVIYAHDASNPTNIIGGDFTIKKAAAGSTITLLTDNTGIAKGYADTDTAAERNNVSEVLNKLAQKLYYTANDGKLVGTVKIADGLTASSTALKTGAISFSTADTGTKTAGQGFYDYTPVDDSVLTDPITGGDDAKYQSLGIEKTKGTYDFTSDATIQVTRGTSGSYLGAIESSNGPITVNADGKTLNVSFIVPSASTGAHAVATPMVSFGSGNKDVSIKAGALKLSAQTTNGSTARGIFANRFAVSIDADTTISGLSAVTEANGIYAGGTGGTVNMTGNLTVDKGTAATYYALKTEGTGTINVNVKDGKAQDGVVKITGDAYTAATNATINLALKGATSSWTGRSLYAASGSGSSTSYGNFNLWLSDGASWTNEGTTAPAGFAGSHVTSFVGGDSAANAGNIFQNDTNPLTIDNYSGSANVYYSHDASNPTSIIGGDFTVKQAADGSNITLITDNAGIAKGYADTDTAAERNTVSEVLNKLAQKLYYTANDGNLSGTVKIAEGLTASSAALKTGNISFSTADTGTKTAGQGFYDYTPAEDKKEYKTGAITESETISETRELDSDDVATVTITEPNAKDGGFVSALYAAGSTEKANPMTVALGGKGLSLAANSSDKQAAAIYAGANTYIDITNSSDTQKLAITASNTDTRAAHGIYADGGAHLKITGPVTISNITTAGDSANGISIQGKQSDITIEGPLTIQTVKGERERGLGMSASGINVTGEQSSVTVTGAVDISGVRGAGIRLAGADTKGSVGGGTITAAEDADKSKNFAAARVQQGQLDINMKDGKAGTTTTKITGDMYVTGQYGKKVVEYSGGELIDWTNAGILNVALTDANSFWTGVAAYDQYTDDYGTGGNTTHDIGELNLYLQNGATWTNEQQSHITTTTLDAAKQNWAGSTIANLYGGSSATNAGLIYQNDENPISVVNYSGNTTVFYKHDASDPTKITGGNFSITNAAENSAITLVTDNAGISSGWNDDDDATAKDKVNEVLNQLAQKLFYKSYSDNHLTGTVKIADGLTASSAALKTGAISFSTATTGTKTEGQGFYEYASDTPSEQTTTEFTTSITGVKDNDTAYVEGGVTKDGVDYIFTKDTTFNVNKTEKVNPLPAIYLDDKLDHTVNVDATGHTLTINATTNKIFGNQYGIATTSYKDLNIKADKIIINAETSKGRIEAINLGGVNSVYNNPDTPFNLTIDSDLDLYVQGKQYTLGLFAVGNANGTFNGNITAMGKTDASGNYTWGIQSQEAVSNYYASHLLYAGNNYTLQQGPTITVNGNVNAKVDANGLMANGGHSKMTVNGGGYLEINPENSYGSNFYALIAECGTTSMNVNLDSNYKALSARDNDLVIKGNISASSGAVNVNEPETLSIVNLGLATKDSEWTGLAYNKHPNEGITLTDKTYAGETITKTFYGYINLFLQNGATWKNQEWGKMETKGWGGIEFSGSHISSFVGGESEDKAGNIFQNDTNPLTIDEYSGYTNVYYAHDETDPTNITGGDFNIKKAADGSRITFITDNKGLTAGYKTTDTAEDQNRVSEVLNKLAQKLYYTANDGKLSGTVKIAEGLTASSAALKTGDISFSTADTGTKTAGQGFYDYTPVDDSVLTDPITGGNDAKYQSLGIETTKGIYDFASNATIQVTKGTYGSYLGAIESSNGPITINADGKTLNVSYMVPTGSNVARAVATPMVSFGSGNKDVSIKAGALKLSAKTVNGFYAQGIFANRFAVSIDADTTISGISAGTEANGIYAGGTGGIVNMTGNLTVDKGTAATYYALKTDGTGTINVNVKDGKAQDGVVKITGDVYTQRTDEEDWSGDTETTTSTINLALKGATSSWTGRSLYKAASESDTTTSYGNFNLWLSDGASWTNKGTAAPTGFAGSHVTSFVGGDSAANAGNIFQSDTKSLTIDNYSGSANVYYAHDASNPTSIIGGDFTVKQAADGSNITLITDNAGIAKGYADTDTADERNTVSEVLNKLAQKLYYTANDGKLAGTVKIADGLTASSAALKTGAISFSTADTGTKTAGQGFYDYTPVKEQKITAFTTPITGVQANDTIYVDDGVLIDEGEHYVFTKDTGITVGRDSSSSGVTAAINIAKDVGHAVDIKAAGKTLTINANSTGNNGTHSGIAANSTEGTTITADKLIINAISDKGRIEGFNVGDQGQVNKDNANKLTVKGDVDLNVQGVGMTLGIYAAGNSEVTIDGNLTAMGDADHEWGLYSKNGGYRYYGSSLIYSGSNYTLQMGPKVTVNGNVNAKVNGNGIFANGGSAKLTVNGGGYLEVNKESAQGYYALIAECATASMNVYLDSNDKATSARRNDLVLKGNISASSGAMNTAEPELESVVNLGLATKDSEWTGVAFNKFGDNGLETGGKTFTGSINVYLQNGATWNNEQWGTMTKPGSWDAAAVDWAGSHLDHLYGGTSEANAGHIFQKDANPLTIDNLSGYTNVYYAHTGNGEATTDYTAGDTIIRKAAEGANISLITDNTGVDMTNVYSVTNVLNALAGKLYYSAYVNGETNLSGFVKIAEGLTASASTLQTGEIEFQKDKDGQGKYKEDTLKPGIDYPDEQQHETYSQAITGDEETDYQYRQDGVKKEDDSYVFTKNPTTITVDNDTASNGAVIDATENDITLKANDAALIVESKADDGTGIIAAKGNSVSFTGKELTAKGTAGAVADGGNISVTGDFKAEGTETGIDANGGTVTVKGNLTATASEDSGVGLNAYEGGTVNVEGKTTATGDMAVTATGENAAITLKGDAAITGTNIAASAKDGATVTIAGGKATIVGALEADGGKLTVGDENGIVATSDLSVSNEEDNEGEMVINVIGKESTLTGGYQIKNGGKLTANVKDGGTWTLKDYTAKTAVYGLRAANDEAADEIMGDFVLNGGTSEAKAGNIVMTKTEDQVVSEYSGYMNVYYAHTGNGEATTDYDAAGNFVIERAAEGSHISLITDKTGVTYKEENVAKLLNALAGKLYYSASVYGEHNLTGSVKLAEGLTSSSAETQIGATKFQEQTGDIEFQYDKKGQGKYVDGSMDPGFKTISDGDYETFVMKGVRSAATTMFHAWRDNMQDTYRGADLADEDGIFAKVLGGKTESDVKGVHETNTYKGAQIGYDKAMKNGWHAGVAFDYRDGDSDYLLGGKGEDKLYSFGVYGVKTLADNSYFRIAAKAGHVSNKYDVYTEYRLNSLHGDYGVTAYGVTAEYGKTFASETSYITPKVQFTWTRVDGRDYTAMTPNGAIMDIFQDDYQSYIGRLGVEAGMKKAKGNFYGGLYLAHEFGGDINTRYYANDGDWKSTAFSGSDTWVELVLGGHYNAGSRTQIYADFARDFSGDFEHQWKLDAGVRFSF